MSGADLVPEGKFTNKRQARKSVAVVGAGWAGCAAALELVRKGYRVVLLEAARTLGGRARRVQLDGRMIDNGQHIMLGAYRETLRLMDLVGIDPAQAFLRFPVQMCHPPGSGGMEFAAPRLPAPLHLLVALVRAKGLARADKLSLARFTTAARWMGWRLDTDCTVAQLLERFDQTPNLVKLMWNPLCVSALNTPPERASAQVFLNVLHASLAAPSRAASDMMLPRLDMTALFPQKVAEFIEQHDGRVRPGATVKRLCRNGGTWQLEVGGEAVAGDWTAWFDGVVLATQASHAASLLSGIPDGPERAALAESGLAASLNGFAHEPITTCYLQYHEGMRLERPLFALVDNGAAGDWGQFVFDRGHLDGQHAGMLSVVISASTDALAQGHPALAQAVAAQLARAFGREELAAPLWCKVITEKRATFACTPGLPRPENATGLHGLVLAGDYTAGDFPATLEAATRSGVLAAAVLAAQVPP